MSLLEFQQRLLLEVKTALSLHEKLSVKAKVFSLEKKLLNHDPILIDIRGLFGRKDAERMGFCYRDL